MVSLLQDQTDFQEFETSCLINCEMPDNMEEQKLTQFLQQEEV
jgi:hypothetical protein